MPDRNHCQSVVCEGVAERNGKCAEARQALFNSRGGELFFNPALNPFE
jgi:hypothetical protein